MGVSSSVLLLQIPTDLPRSQRSALTRGVAEARLRDETGICVRVNANYKGGAITRWPGRGETPLAVSFSYCKGWAAIAYAHVRKLGVDIEPENSVPLNAARRVMSLSDLEVFEQAKAEERSRIATRYWTSAEAISKAAGEGLPMMLRRTLDLQCASEGSWGPYQFAVRDLDAGLTCALATDGTCNLPQALEDVVVLNC